VFYVAITLALAALLPASPVVSLTAGIAIATCIAPEENCSAFAADAVDGAEREVLVGAYSLTTGSAVLEALVRAAQRGVTMRLIADRTAPCEHRSGLEPLAQAGASVWIDRGVRIAHAKTMVIDGKVTLMGSMNWSSGAARNSEDLNLVISPEVADTYAVHWRQRLAASAPFAGREEWCRQRLQRSTNRLIADYVLSRIAVSAEQSCAPLWPNNATRLSGKKWLCAATRA
jgi:phosphatidylserine/phosphatidylglycerophosphate/cardiolipin synthase-like enzyme